MYTNRLQDKITPSSPDPRTGRLGHAGRAAEGSFPGRREPAPGFLPAAQGAQGLPFPAELHGTHPVPGAAPFTSWQV